MTRLSLSILFTSLFLLPAVSECTTPDGMIEIPAGQFYMGRDAAHRKDESPRHLVKLSAFLLDATLVTNQDFGAFVKSTRFETTAEKRGFGMVGNEGLPEWKWTKTWGANWRNPFGKKNAPRPRDDHPVVSVSWFDAEAYCKWKRKRLPTEAEWEYAARAGKSDVRFAWGNSPKLGNGKFGLNFWQGRTHLKSEQADGHLYTSPVKAFPPNDWGMYDTSGNVWQWVADWYGKDYFAEIATPEGVRDPKGPAKGTHKVARGGSWWCSERTCEGYGLFYRGKAKPKAVFNNNGFRCAKDLN